MKRNQAWHFLKRVDGVDKLRDGSTAPADGKWLTYKGKLEMCKSGLHFSVQAYDALQYAPGEILCLVEYGGEIIMGDDKGVCSRRRIVARMDATELLYYFARQQAISALDHWQTEPPQVVLDYLMGDDAASDAASDAARDAARAAAYAASAAAYAASAAAYAAYAARAAARDAARAAAYAAYAASDAARDAAYAARAAASDAARAAARDAARAAASELFNALVAECFEAFL